MTDWIKDLDIDFENLPERKEFPDGGGRVPDGNHTFLIVDAEQSQDKPMFKATLEVETFNKRRLTKTFYFGARADLALADLRAIGIEPKTKEDLAEVPKMLIGRRCAGRVQTKPGEKYSNIYLNKLIEIVEVKNTADDFSFPELGDEQEL